MPRTPPLRTILLSLALACGKDGDETTGGATTTSTATDASSSSSGTSTTTSTATDPTDPSATTGVDVAGFERFRIDRSAGPCAPGGDCDGFVEVLESGLLRVEIFGEVGNAVTETTLAPADLAAALQVFADPALLALLDGPEPVCDPPTDIFEQMTVVIGGMTHDAATTICEQPPIAAARATAYALRDKYLP